MSNGYLAAADNLIKPALQHLIQTNIINAQEAQMLLGKYGNNRLRFQQILTQRYPNEISEDILKQQLMEFIQFNLKELRQSQTSWGQPVQSFGGGFQQQQTQQMNPSFTQPSGFSQPSGGSFTTNPYPDTTQSTGSMFTQQPVQQQPIQQQPIQQTESPKEMVNMDNLFTKATPVGNPNDDSIERFMKAQSQVVRYDNTKFNIGQYKLYRGYNTDEEAINAVQRNLDQTSHIKKPFINFIQYNKLETLDVPQTEACEIFNKMHEQTDGRDATQSIRIILDILENVSAAHSRIISQFFVDRINEILPFLTSSTTPAKEAVLDNFPELLDLIEETAIPFLMDLRQLPDYDKVLSEILVNAIMVVISNTTICNFDEDENIIGDVLHAVDNQHNVEGYINRDYYYLATKEDEEASTKFKDLFELMNNKISSKTVINVSHMVVHTNMYPEEYRLFVNNLPKPICITTINNHIDQYLQEFIKAKWPISIAIQPNDKETHSFKVSKTIDGVLRLSKK